MVEKQRGMIKIADLKLGRGFIVPVKKFHKIVTLQYRGPEDLLGATHYSLSVDIWSVSCIFAEMQKVFNVAAEMSQMQSLFTGHSEV
jgi:cyclin-dependent kinase